MKWTKTRMVLSVGIAVVVGMAWASALRAEMVETNLCYGKATSASHTPSYAPTTHYTTWNPVIVDDLGITQSPAQRVSVGCDEGWIQVDLTGSPEVTKNLKWVDIMLDLPNKWKGLSDCRIEGLDDDGLISGYQENIPWNTLGGQFHWKTDVDWSGVRYVRVYKYANTQGNYSIRMHELRAGGDVEGYTNFIGGVTATANSDQDSYYHNDVYLTNNSGMNDQGADGLGSPTAHSLLGTGNWLPNPDIGFNPEVNFDLGGSYAMDAMVIWNFYWATTTTSYTNRGTKDALVEYSSDGGSSWTALPDDNGGGLETNGNYTIDQAPTDTTATSYHTSGPQLTIDLTGLGITANQFRITGLSNHGGTNNYRGLGEVRFYGVPEPSTFVLLCLGVVGLLMGRRR